MTPEATDPLELPDVVLGLLALHGGHLAGEEERGPAEVDRGRRGAVGRGRGGRPARGEVGGDERLDHGLDGEVVVARLGPARRA